MVRIGDVEYGSEPKPKNICGSSLEKWDALWGPRIAHVRNWSSVCTHPANEYELSVSGPAPSAEYVQAALLALSETPTTEWAL